jgi:hypothetical protein
VIRSQQDRCESLSRRVLLISEGLGYVTEKEREGLLSLSFDVSSAHRPNQTVQPYSGYRHELVGHAEALTLDLKALGEISIIVALCGGLIIVALCGGLPIGEHLDEVHESHVLYAVIEVLRVMPIVGVVMIEAFAQRPARRTSEAVPRS